METNLTSIRGLDLQSLFGNLTPRNGAQGLGAFGGLPRLAKALGVEGAGGPGAAGIGGVPGLLDALTLSGEGPDAGAGVFQLFNLQINIAVAQASSLTVSVDDAVPGIAPQSVEETAANIVNFATGLFGAFAAQNPELSEEEALARFETVVREAIDEGIADAQAILEGLGGIDEEAESLIADIRAAIAIGLDAFFVTPEVEETDETSGPTSAEGTALPAAGSFGITRIEQVSVSVSLQVARARIETRGAQAVGANQPSLPALDFDDGRPFDAIVRDFIELANELFDRLAAGDDIFGAGGVQGVLDQVLDIFGQGFDDAFRIFDDFGASALPDGSPVAGTFQLAFDSVELNISQTRIETAGGLVFERTSISLRVTQIRIQGAVGESLAPGQTIQPIPLPETPEDIAQNVLDFASGLFGIFRAQNPEASSEQALADFVALVRDAAAHGAEEAHELLEAFGALDDEEESVIEQALARLDELLAERFPGTDLLTA